MEKLDEVVKNPPEVFKSTKKGERLLELLRMGMTLHEAHQICSQEFGGKELDGAAVQIEDRVEKPQS